MIIFLEFAETLGNLKLANQKKKRKGIENLPEVVLFRGKNFAELFVMLQEALKNEARGKPELYKFGKHLIMKSTILCRPAKSDRLSIQLNDKNSQHNK